MRTLMQELRIAIAIGFIAVSAWVTTGCDQNKHQFGLQPNPAVVPAYPFAGGASVARTPTFTSTGSSLAAPMAPFVPGALQSPQAAEDYRKKHEDARAKLGLDRSENKDWPIISEETLAASEDKLFAEIADDVDTDRDTIYDSVEVQQKLDKYRPNGAIILGLKIKNWECDQWLKLDESAGAKNSEAVIREIRRLVDAAVDGKGEAEFMDLSDNSIVGTLVDEDSETAKQLDTLQPGLSRKIAWSRAGSQKLGWFGTNWGVDNDTKAAFMMLSTFTVAKLTTVKPAFALVGDPEDKYLIKDAGAFFLGGKMRINSVQGSFWEDVPFVSLLYKGIKALADGDESQQNEQIEPVAINKNMVGSVVFCSNGGPGKGEMWMNYDARAYKKNGSDDIDHLGFGPIPTKWIYATADLGANRNTPSKVSKTEWDAGAFIPTTSRLYEPLYGTLNSAMDLERERNGDTDESGKTRTRVKGDGKDGDEDGKGANKGGKGGDDADQNAGPGGGKVGELGDLNGKKKTEGEEKKGEKKEDDAAKAAKVDTATQEMCAKVVDVTDKDTIDMTQPKFQALVNCYDQMALDMRKYAEGLRNRSGAKLQQVDDYDRRLKSVDDTRTLAHAVLDLNVKLIDVLKTATDASAENFEDVSGTVQRTITNIQQDYYEPSLHTLGSELLPQRNNVQKVVAMINDAIARTTMYTYFVDSAAKAPVIQLRNDSAEVVVDVRKDVEGMLAFINVSGAWSEGVRGRGDKQGNDEDHRLLLANKGFIDALVSAEIQMKMIGSFVSSKVVAQPDVHGTLLWILPDLDGYLVENEIDQKIINMKRAINQVMTGGMTRVANDPKATTAQGVLGGIDYLAKVIGPKQLLETRDADGVAVYHLGVLRDTLVARGYQKKS